LSLDFSLCYVGDLLSRRRSDYRTWEELTKQERRRGLAVLGAVGACVVTAMVLVVGGGGSDAETGAAAPPTIDVSARLTAWYASTAQVRAEIVTAVDEVRGDIQTLDGTALKPACAQLGEVVAKIGPLGVPPVESASRTWTDGATAYSAAVTSCGNLFDGTAVAPPVLLKRTTDALNTADGHWTRLASDVGATAQIIPSA
jgi:hypothetical protein